MVRILFLQLNWADNPSRSHHDFEWYLKNTLGRMSALSGTPPCERGLVCNAAGFCDLRHESVCLSAPRLASILFRSVDATLQVCTAEEACGFEVSARRSKRIKTKVREGRGLELASMIAKNEYHGNTCAITQYHGNTSSRVERW